MKCPFCGRSSNVRPSFHGTFRTVHCPYEDCGKGFIVPPSPEATTEVKDDYNKLIKTLYQDLIIAELMDGPPTKE